MNQTSQDVRSGLLAAASAFTLWGLLPLYWRLLQAVSPFEILCHRIVWSMVFTAVILSVQGRWSETMSLLKSKKIWIIALSSLFVGLNWFLYIVAVNTGHVLEASLGYYINPLVNVALGRLVFGDRLRSLQLAAVALAALGVLNAVVVYGHPPYLALGIAVSFALYGLTRKVSPAQPIPGMFWETAVLSIPALIFIFHSGIGMGRMGRDMDLLLASTGAVTSIPLLMFVFGARRLTLTTIGLLQYIAPSITFVLGVVVFKEKFLSSDLLTFALIWSALGLYTVAGLRQYHHGPSRRRAA